MKKKLEESSLRRQIFSINIIVIIATILLTLVGTLFIALYQNNKSLENSLLSTARGVSQTPLMEVQLELGQVDDVYWAMFDESISQLQGIDSIVVANMDGLIYYHSDEKQIGNTYQIEEDVDIFAQREAFITGGSVGFGVMKSAYAPVVSEDGTLLGFVMVGIDMAHVTKSVTQYAISFGVVAIIVLILGGLLSFKLSDRIKRLMLGYEPEVLLGLFRQREEILETLEEGVLAIDKHAKVMFSNKAIEQMLRMKKSEILGKDLHELIPNSSLDRLLTSKRSEYNIPYTFSHNERILAHHMPIMEDRSVIGAVAILRNRTEVTKLANDLTGAQHIVEAMRAYTHEFMNKLHVIGGLLHLGEAEKAEAYIMNVTAVQRQAVGAIMRSIHDPSVAALLLGKTSRCSELGVRMTLAEGSVLKDGANVLPTDAMVTILGNLIENAAEALNLSVPKAKEVIVTIKESDTDLLICVEDTGPGIAFDLKEKIFEKGFSTKSATRGTGLSIVSSIVDAYHGSVRVESEIGHGTTFWVRFPKEH